MDKNEQSTFKSNPGSMLQIFLELNIIEQIKQIQKNENLKDEREVIIRAIQNYSEKNISKQLHMIQKNDMEGIVLKDHNYSKSNIWRMRIGSDVVRDRFAHKIPHTTFDGKLDLEKLEKILVVIKSENLIKKLPQHKIYNMTGAGMIHRFQNKILPVKFSLMCLSKLILEQNSPWVDLNEFKNYTLESAKIFIKKFDSSLIQEKFKVKTGFPIIKVKEFKSDDDSYLLLARSAKRFTEEFVGRKLQKHEGVQLGGACFELGLIKAKIPDSENEKSPGNIYVTLSESGQEFVSYKNQLINFVYKNIQNEPSSIFSQQERQFYLKKILPKFNFENKFVKYLMTKEEIPHSSKIKEWFETEFGKFCTSEFPDEHVILQENTIRIHSNTIMSRLMEFEIFTKDPKSKSGPYTRMKNTEDLL